jgi:hypothetical protein
MFWKSARPFTLTAYPRLQQHGEFGPTQAGSSAVFVGLRYMAIQEFNHEGAEGTRRKEKYGYKGPTAYRGPFLRQRSGARHPGKGP